MLQTIGHCEYVLKHENYKPLAEVPDRIDQYCPRNPEVVAFPQRNGSRSISSVFGHVKYFHLGADEAYTLGECPRCRAYAAAHSLSELYIDHINAVSRPLIARGIRPIIWGDMAPPPPRGPRPLSRKIVDPSTGSMTGSTDSERSGLGPRESLTRDELDAPTLERFGAYLFPARR